MKYFTSEEDRSKREELLNLMKAWKKVIRKKGDIIFPDDSKHYPAIDFFNSDGFFPGYFSGNKKILFIARESRNCSGKDRIQTELNWFNKGAKYINCYAYWRRILYITYGIQNGCKLDYEEIPYADEIIKKMVEENNYGFAIMNISKYSNDQEDGAIANYELINQFLKDSDLDKENYIRKEIELLEPDIIITANLWDGNINNEVLEKIFPLSDCTNMKPFKDAANMWNFKLKEKTVKLIDLYHFSSRKSDQKHFYEPVMKLLK